MKKSVMLLSSLLLVLGYSRSSIATDSSSNQPSAAGTPGSPSMGSNAPAVNTSGQPNPFEGGAQATQTPPADWTNLKGMVQMVDAQAKTIQIKDDSGKLLQVPVDRQVKILRDGKAVKLTQIQTGDSIRLSKSNAQAGEEPKTY
jgi:hypothetical protein